MERGVNSGRVAARLWYATLAGPFYRLRGHSPAFGTSARSASSSATPPCASSYSTVFRGPASAASRWRVTRAIRAFWSIAAVRRCSLQHAFLSVATGAWATASVAALPTNVTRVVECGSNAVLEDGVLGLLYLLHTNTGFRDLASPTRSNRRPDSCSALADWKRPRKRSTGVARTQRIIAVRAKHTISSGL